jgi:glyoxylase-like metal-dependent hydrolase (beta-lactamase superfamily II)
VHKNDLKWVRDGLPLPEEIIKQMMIKDVSNEYLEDFSLQGFTHNNPKDVSNYSFEELSFIHTPGHSPGSICVYDKQRKILFSGDVVYEGTIYCHYESTNPRKLYESIKKISKYDIERIMSGHYNEPSLEIVNDLYNMMEGLEFENKLCHGSGLKCKNDICLQL